jgi:hypothetical protein
MSSTNKSGTKYEKMKIAPWSEISGSQDGEYEDNSLLGYSAV